MNIFISWSGESSKEIAHALKNWIPMVLQSAKPYFTPSDIEKGSKWESEITKKLNECKVGIICLTPENTEKPWILFEAGALSNKLEKSRVCPLLFGLANADLKGPLATFQTTEFNKEDFKKLMKSINILLDENKISESIFDEIFETFYPKLEEKVNTIIATIDKTETNTVVKRTDRDILEEILQLTRKQYVKPRRLDDLDQVHFYPDKKLEEINKTELEFIHKRIMSYIKENNIRLKEIRDIDYDDVVDYLRDNLTIRKFAGNPENLKTIIQNYFDNHF